MIRQTTHVDAVRAAQQACQNALDHLTIVCECLDHLEEICEQIARAPDKSVSMDSALLAVSNELVEIKDAISDVYFQTLETRLTHLRYVAEKAAKDGER